MPSVDISSPSQASSGGKSGAFGTGIPTPLLLIGVGGGLGLIVFLSRKSSDNGDDPSKGTLLPNTAIMLGSLQQMLLNLQGTVSTGNADLSDQMSGGFGNLGLQIDTQTGQMQSGFQTINDNITAGIGTISGQNDAISSAIANLGTQNTSAFQGVVNMLQGLGYSQGQILGYLTDQQASLGQIVSNQNDQSAAIDGLGNQISGTQADVNAIGRFLGWQFYQIPNRYATYIPGQGPGSGNVGTNVIGTV